MTWIEWKESGARSFSKSIKGMPEERDMRAHQWINPQVKQQLEKRIE